MTGFRSPCGAFEETLVAHLEKTDGRVEAPSPLDPHAASCAACAALLDALAATAETLGALRAPVPSPELAGRLSAIPHDLKARSEAARVLDFLRPGALRAPEPSADFFARLLFLPTRMKDARAARDEAPPPLFSLAFMRRLLGDWRFAVVAAYAATLLIVTLMKVDPLSVAQNAATDLTVAGERAIASARAAATSRIQASPLTKRLDYRLYRAVAASRARAVAYSQLVFEKVFGGTVQETARARTSSNQSDREPLDRTLRS